MIRFFTILLSIGQLTSEQKKYIMIKNMLKREYERQRCGCMSEKKELVLDDGRIESIQYQSPEQLYEDLILRVKKYHPSDDISLIEGSFRGT